jgi:hypothetical protein
MREVKKEELIQRCFSCKHKDYDIHGDNDSCCAICGEAVGNGNYYDCYEPDDEDEEEWEDFGTSTDEYSGNMPCDTYGMCACSTSCSQWAQCHA